MTLLLELSQLGEHDDMPEVDVRGGGIDPQLDPEGIARGELLFQPACGEDLFRPALEDFEISHA